MFKGNCYRRVISVWKPVQEAGLQNWISRRSTKDSRSDAWLKQDSGISVSRCLFGTECDNFASSSGFGSGRVR